MQVRKIYGTPLTVAQMVDNIVDNSNDIVILTVLERLAVRAQQEEFRKNNGIKEDWHKNHKITGPYDRGCGCKYCQALHHYIATKMSAHRLRRRIDAYDYTCRPYENTMGYEQLKQLEKEWPKLRAIKEEIRLQAGL